MRYVQEKQNGNRTASNTPGAIHLQVSQSMQVWSTNRSPGTFSGRRSRGLNAAAAVVVVVVAMVAEGASVEDGEAVSLLLSLLVTLVTGRGRAVGLLSDLPPPPRPGRVRHDTDTTRASTGAPVMLPAM